MLNSLRVMVTVFSIMASVPWNKTRFHIYFATLFTYRLSTVSKKLTHFSGKHQGHYIIYQCMSQLASPKEGCDRQNVSLLIVCK